MPGNETNWHDISWFCRSPELEIQNPKSLPENLFYQSLFTVPTILALMVLGMEATIYLAYFKDLIFSAVISFIFIFIWNQSYKSSVRQKSSTGINSAQHTLSDCLITLYVIMIVFMLFTLIIDFDSAFYRKAKVYERRIKELREKRQE